MNNATGPASQISAEASISTPASVSAKG